MKMSKYFMQEDSLWVKMKWITSIPKVLSFPSSIYRPFVIFLKEKDSHGSNILVWRIFPNPCICRWWYVWGEWLSYGKGIVALVPVEVSLVYCDEGEVFLHLLSAWCPIKLMSLQGWVWLPIVCRQVGFKQWFAFFWRFHTLWASSSRCSK